MTGLTFLIPIALLAGLAGLIAFLWSVRSGQYEDLDGAAQRILLDDGPDDGPDDEPQAGPKAPPAKARADESPAEKKP
ncbi:cbb3-type cytochrome oxidase assembly protein CcoS [Sandaracinobacteroides sp. A072]|uniref:cbb3-type cytochrome oxidase assembly protein CcoS n=1 Tax=Sandaracinobacteroides sp. A072 TaxID=3461146 RepID=UPI0040427679